MDYFDLILQNGLSDFRRSHGSTQNLHTAISSQASQIGTFLDDEAARAAFLTSFTEYASHLVEFLEFNDRMQSVRHRAGSKMISCEVLVLICSMLAHAEFDLADVDAMDKLVIAAIKHALPLQPATLKVIATGLTEKPGLLERVTSSEEGAEIICDLFSVHFISAVPSISEGWARKLIGLCSVCAGSPICHGVPTEVEKWRALTETIAALEKHLENCQAPASQHTRAPTDVVLRKLNADDKKSYSAARRCSMALEPEIPPLPDRVVAMLNELGLQQPTSSRAIAMLLDEIRATEIPAVLRAVLPTFPCRPCHDLSQDPKALAEKDKRMTRARADSGFCSGEVPEGGALFGTMIGLWKVLLSAAALKDIQREMLGGYKKVLEARLRRLASGKWKGGKLSYLSGTAAQRKYLDPPLLEAAVGRQLRILWQLGAGPTEDGNYRQHLKIWRVLETGDVPDAIDRVIMVWRTKILQPEDDPAFSKSPIWDEASATYLPRDLHIIRKSPHRRDSTDTSPLVSIEDRRALEEYNRFFEVTKPVMDSFLTNSTNAEFPFDTSSEEIKVIKHSGSGTLIRGRSGTGKTTCLVHKLVRNYTSQKHIIGQPPRQILLTRSKLLVEKLKLYTKRLVESQLSKAISTQAHSDDFTLDEENLMFSKALGSLQDDDFPLVCTFDQLLKLLENTVEYSNRQKFRDKKAKPVISAASGHYVRRSQVVDFALFKSEYWKQFPSSMTRHCEPGLVFAEILGVIKGSVSNEGEIGTLSRDDYLDLSHKKAPTFLHRERQQVYDIYLRYESRKARNGDRDGIDRVASLLNFMRTADPDFRRSVETFFGEIYVDEVQDQRCMDITLLLKLVQNPSGVHFAGDSAQCISRDSTFRFSDVKAMFYHQFKPLAEAKGNNNIVQPKLFDLNKNFRSHQGIVSLASFVMELLYMGFPHSVDKMEEEKGQYGGSIPTMFVGWGAEVLADMFVGPTDLSGRVANFGAEQVILVRDEIVKEEVKQKIGEDTALVLSILDSKGMEFDDVFLLDFFTSSPTPSGLRILKDILVPGSNRDKIERDALLCSELKHLYVAVTRSRIQLWILESSVASAEPIVKLVAGNGSNPRVEVVRRNDPDATEKLKKMKPAVSSDPKKFSERGYQFLQRGLYKEASFCFRRAKDSRGQTISKAHLKMEEGRMYRGEGSTDEFLHLFREAVELFREASQFGNAAFCLEDMNHLEEAGDVWVDIGRHDKAASLYKQCQSWRKAHQCYDTLNSYADAADALRQGELFDDLILYLQLHRTHLEPSKVAAYSKICTILLSQGRIKEEHQEFIFDSLGSDQEKEEFLRKFRLGKQLVEVLVKKHDYREAFHEHILGGRIAEALELGLEHFHDESSVGSKELLLPLHFTEFERLLKALGKTPGESKQSRPYNSLELPHEIASALSEWASIRDQLRSSNICDVFSALPEGIHKDIFAILMVVNWRDLKLLDDCESVALTELRGIAQALIRAVSIWGSGRDPNRELPLSTAIVMGAFSLPDTQEMWHLQYSPIREGQQGQSLVGSKSLSITIQNKLLVRMLELLLELEQTARTIWDPVAGDLCSDHISRGNCTNIRCPNRHVPPSRAEYRSRIEGLEMMSTLVCSFNVVHVDLRYNKFGGEEILGHFRERFHPQKRRWLEHFLKEAIFRSAIQHDCDASTEMVSKIASGRKEYAAIFYGLESLLFHRLGRTGESHLWKDLSSIFEQLQLSESLAPSVAGRFRRYAKPIFHRPSAFWRLSPKEEYENELCEAFHGLNTLMNGARTNAAVSFRSNLKYCLAKLSKLPLNDFTSFHSIIGIFERLAAFLMLWTCQSACVFPASWIKIHLPVLIRHPDQLTRKQPERDIYGDCLVTLLEGFMSLLERLSAAPPPFNQRTHESFQFTYGTRKINNVPHKARTFGKGIQERNRNLLAIAVIHLTSMNIPLRGTGDVYERAQKLFLGRYLVARFYRRPILGMLESLHASFAQYGGKDSLAFVNIKDRPLPAVFYPLSVRGVPTYTLASLTESAKPHWMSSGDTAEESDETSQDVVVRAAVRKLQAFWRRRGPYLPKHRLSLELPRGKESAFIFDNIIKPSLKAIREQQQLQILNISHGKEADELFDHGEEGQTTNQDKPPMMPRFIPGIVAKTMVLDTVGVDFFVTLGNLRKDAIEADKLSQRVLTDSKIPSSAVEELIESNDMVELNKIVKKVSREMLAVKEVAEIYADPKRDSQELRRRLVREKDKAEITRWKLMDIVGTLEMMYLG